MKTLKKPIITEIKKPTIVRFISWGKNWLYSSPGKRKFL